MAAWDESKEEFLAAKREERRVAYEERMTRGRAFVDQIIAAMRDIVKERSTDHVCPFCDQPLTDQELSNGYRGVLGWEKKREAGGTNAVALRKTIDLWAHARCVDEQRPNGVPQ